MRPVLCFGSEDGFGVPRWSQGWQGMTMRRCHSFPALEVRLHLTEIDLCCAPWRFFITNFIQSFPQYILYTYYFLKRMMMQTLAITKIQVDVIMENLLSTKGILKLIMLLKRNRRKIDAIAYNLFFVHLIFVTQYIENTKTNVSTEIK
jgi:hypothetical protein